MGTVLLVYINMITRSETRFLDKQNISKHLYCSICMEVFRSPMRTPCGHIFCLICIENWANIGKKYCPICKERVSNKKLVKDLLATNLVDELFVRCSNAECGWTGAYGELKFHKVECKFKVRKNLEVPANSIMIQDDDQFEIVEKHQHPAFIDLEDEK